MKQASRGRAPIRRELVPAGAVVVNRGWRAVGGHRFEENWSLQVPSWLLKDFVCSVETYERINRRKRR